MHPALASDELPFTARPAAVPCENPFLYSRSIEPPRFPELELSVLQNTSVCIEFRSAASIILIPSSVFPALRIQAEAVFKDACLATSPCRSGDTSGSGDPSVPGRLLMAKTKQRNTKIRLIAVDAEPGKLPVA
jgi:hypothetical protein